MFVSTSLVIAFPESEFVYRLTGCLLLGGFASIRLPHAIKEVRPHLYRGWLRAYGEWLGGKSEKGRQSVEG